MNYYISSSLEVVKVEVMEMRKQMELQSVHNWFTDENKAKEMAVKMKGILYENR